MQSSRESPRAIVRWRPAAVLVVVGDRRSALRRSVPAPTHLFQDEHRDRDRQQHDIQGEQDRHQIAAAVRGVARFSAGLRLALGRSIRPHASGRVTDAGDGTHDPRWQLAQSLPEAAYRAHDRTRARPRPRHRGRPWDRRRIVPCRRGPTSKRWRLLQGRQPDSPQRGETGHLRTGRRWRATPVAGSGAGAGIGDGKRGIRCTSTWRGLLNGWGGRVLLFHHE